MSRSSTVRERSLSNDRVLLIGDIIIDEYTYGSKLGVSAETPTLVAEFKKKETFVGGAGLVARNLLRLGCEVVLINPGPPVIDTMRSSSDPPTIDELGKMIHLSPRFLGWRHTEKHRYFVDSYKLLQYDVLNYAQLVDSTFYPMMSMINDQLKDGKIGAVIVSDNRHGCLNYGMARRIVEGCSNVRIPLYVDSQVSQSESNHHWYFGAQNFVINSHERNEILRNIGGSVESDFYDEYVGMQIAEHLGCEKVYVKMGARGSVSFGKEKGSMEISSPPPMSGVIDVCGAGDAYLAALVTSKGNQVFANRWAGLSVQLPGTRVPSIGVNDEQASS
jgi:D-beta-D-heptose 7-phosphate kinase/D-beta-D-heptose 1-phosphate adenosyltransferase